MTSSLSNKRWVYLCLWLWKLLRWIWGAIIFALFVNIGSTWLTSKPQQFDLVGTPIGWLLEHLNISIPLGGGLIVLSIITRLVTALNSQPDQQSLSVAQEERNRNHFLKRLDDHYNKLLEQYLPKNLPQIPLSFHSKPNAIQKNTVLLGRQHQPEQPGSTPSASTSIFQVYKKEAREELLILGEPGAGKTTLLLQLARDLRDQAEQELKDPLPLIVNLSTWANTTRLSLEEWLAEEVAMRYHVSKSLTRHWVKHNQLLPLLDGLDEMPGDRQLTCIDAINTYKQNHLGPLVVCCRSKAYDTLSRKLNLHTAVVVQPLEGQQIDEYFQTEQIGEYFRTNGGSLRSVKKAYGSLRDLVKTPLMLHILILAYKNILDIPNLSKRKPVQDQQKLLFKYYLDSRLEMYRKKHLVSTQHEKQNNQDELNEKQRQNQNLRQVECQLTWLAQQMRLHHLKSFHIEHMQPDWLHATQAYEKYAVRWPTILIGMLLSLLVNALLFNSFDPVRFIVYVFIGGHIGGLFSRAWIENQVVGQQVSPLRHLAGSLGSSLLIGLGVWLSAWLTVGQAYMASDGLHNGLATGLCCAVSSFLLSLLFQRGHNRPNSSSSQLGSISANGASWGKIWQELIKAGHVGNGVLVGISVGLTFSFGTWLFFTQQDGQAYGMTFGIRDGLTYGLTFGLIGILLSVILVEQDINIHPTEILTWSWSSLWKSLLSSRHWGHTVLVGVSVGLGIGVSLGLSTIASQWLGGRSFGFDVGLAIGLGTGLGDGLAYGLTFGIAYWLLLGLFRGLSRDVLPPNRRMKPNEGIWRSVRISLWVGLSSGIVSGLIGVLSMMLYFGLHAGLGQGLNIGLSLGWHAGLNNALHIGLSTGLVVGGQTGLFGGLLACALMGGLACLRHSMLRLLLWRSHNIPFDYPRFLNNAAECILLYKVGGGYEFVHDLLLEHFASLED